MTSKQLLARSLVLMALLALIASAFAYWQLRTMGLFRSPEYDTKAPSLPELQRPAILVLTKTNGFIHKDAIPAASQMLRDVSAANGWSVFITNNAAVHNSQDLKRFDVVVWNNNTGDILTAQQRTAFKQWMEAGGSWLGLHGAGGNRNYAWDWFPETLIGAQFFGHTMSPQFQDADILVADSSDLTAHLSSPWRVLQEEWYAFDGNPRASGSKILLTLDESSYDTSERFFDEPSMPGEHPIAWTHKIGKGTVIYSGIGHQASTYAVPQYREFLRKSLIRLIDTNQLSRTRP